MAKLYFKYGAMGCSKTAQALITKFNYEERNMSVLLLKPAIDTRDGAEIVRSRIGLWENCVTVDKDCDIYKLFNENYNNRVAVIMTISQVAALYDEQGKEYIWPVDNLNEDIVLNLLNKVQLKEKFAKVNKALEQIKEDFK